MVQRIRHQYLVFFVLLLSLLVSGAAAETIYAENFEELRNGLSSNGENTVILTADITAESSIPVMGKITLTTEENANCVISFADCPADEKGFILVGKGAELTVIGNKSGKITITGKHSKDTSLISVHSGNLVLKNTDLKENHLTGSGSAGGAVYADSGKIILERCTITGCSADLGGAVYLTSNEKSSVEGEITGVFINSCTASAGGAVYADYQGKIPELSIPKKMQTKLTISATTVNNCGAENGFGIYATASDIRISGVDFADLPAFGDSNSVCAVSSIVSLDGPQDQLHGISLEKSVIHLVDEFSIYDHATVTLVSDTAVSPYLMKIDRGNISDVVGYFTIVLPDGFLTEKNGKNLILRAYVNFDANGGFGTPLLTDLPCAIRTDLPINPYSREGYTFAGWAETPNGPALYENAGTITLLEPTTLYAVWENKDAESGYFRTITNGGYVEVSGHAPLQYVDLPAGASGDIYLSDSIDVPTPEDMQVFSVFSVNITEYPTGMPSEIGFSLSSTELAGTDADSVRLYSYADGEWKALPTTCSVTGDTAVFEAQTNSLGIFAVVFEESSSAKSPLGIISIIAGICAVCLFRRK